MININFAALTASNSEPLGSASEKLTTGLRVLGLGMVTVFFVLAILWVVLILFKVVFYREKKPTPVKEAPAALAEAEEIPDEVTDDGAIVAAITAAITAYTANDPDFSGGFRVVSFRRTKSSSPWSKSSK